MDNDGTKLLQAEITIAGAMLEIAMKMAVFAARSTLTLLAQLSPSATGANPPGFDEPTRTTDWSR
jgi:hypothetical protein